MTLTHLEAMTKWVVENGERLGLLTADRFGRRMLGIREVCCEVERRMGVECDIADIHKALLNVAVLSPRDDPQAKEWIEAQWAFGYDPGLDPSARRLVVNRRG